MIESTQIELREKTRIADQIVIMGAGKCGKEAYQSLPEVAQKKVVCFFDNNPKYSGATWREKRIVIPQKYNVDTLYVVAIKNFDGQMKAHCQLNLLGIDDADIIDCRYDEHDYEWRAKLTKTQCKTIIEKNFLDVFGRVLDWGNPRSYSEIICSEKLNLDDELHTMLVDKYRVRDWVKKNIGEKYLTKVIGVWKDPTKITFEQFPPSVVLKVNNGSGRNIVIQDKEKANLMDIYCQLLAWQRINYTYNSDYHFEFQYKNVPFVVICEEYMQELAESACDYQIYCFHGEPRYICRIFGAHSQNAKAAFYDTEWRYQPFYVGYPLDKESVPAPAELDEMLQVSRMLSRDFTHVRVDLYDLPDGRVLFSEMSFTNWAGTKRFAPDDTYDFVFGDLVRNQTK